MRLARPPIAPRGNRNKHGRAGEIVFPQERANRSRHRGAAAYYDAQTRDLVAAREALLIAQYGYEPPPLA